MAKVRQGRAYILPKPKRHRVNKSVRKLPHRLSGGPFDGETLYLESPGTFLFTLNGFKGYYDSGGKWCDVL